MKCAVARLLRGIGALSSDRCAVVQLLRGIGGAGRNRSAVAHLLRSGPCVGPVLTAWTTAGLSSSETLS